MQAFFPSSLILTRELGDQIGVSQKDKVGRWGEQPIPTFAKLAETTLFFRGLWVSQRDQARRELQWDFPWEVLQPGHTQKSDGCLVVPCTPFPLVLGSQPATPQSEACLEQGIISTAIPWAPASACHCQ